MSLLSFLTVSPEAPVDRNKGLLASLGPIPATGLKTLKGHSTGDSVTCGSQSDVLPATSLILCCVSLCVITHPEL
jgi:hypothetical protein